MTDVVTTLFAVTDETDKQQPFSLFVTLIPQLLDSSELMADASSEKERVAMRELLRRSVESKFHPLLPNFNTLWPTLAFPPTPDSQKLSAGEPAAWVDATSLLIVSLFKTVLGARSCVLLIEDVSNVDGPSRSTVLALLGALRSVLVVMTSRPIDRRERFGQSFVGELQRIPRFKESVLDGLTRAECTEMICTRLVPELLRAAGGVSSGTADSGATQPNSGGSLASPRTERERSSNPSSAPASPSHRQTRSVDGLDLKQPYSLSEKVVATIFTNAESHVRQADERHSTALYNPYFVLAAAQHLQKAGVLEFDPDTNVISFRDENTAFDDTASMDGSIASGDIAFSGTGSSVGSPPAPVPAWKQQKELLRKHTRRHSSNEGSDTGTADSAGGKGRGSHTDGEDSDSDTEEKTAALAAAVTTATTASNGADPSDVPPLPKRSLSVAIPIPRNRASSATPSGSSDEKPGLTRGRSKTAMQPTNLVSPNSASSTGSNNPFGSFARSKSPLPSPSPPSTRSASPFSVGRANGVDRIMLKKLDVLQLNDARVCKLASVFGPGDFPKRALVAVYLSDQIYQQQQAVAAVATTGTGTGTASGSLKSPITSPSSATARGSFVFGSSASTTGGSNGSDLKSPPPFSPQRSRPHSMSSLPTVTGTGTGANGALSPPPLPASTASVTSPPPPGSGSNGSGGANALANTISPFIGKMQRRLSGASDSAAMEAAVAAAALAANASPATLAAASVLADAEKAGSGGAANGSAGSAVVAPAPTLSPAKVQKRSKELDFSLTTLECQSIITLKSQVICFRDVMLQRACYDTIPHSQLVRLHGYITDWALEQLTGSELRSMLQYHYSKIKEIHVDDGTGTALPNCVIRARAFFAPPAHPPPPPPTTGSGSASRSGSGAASPITTASTSPPVGPPAIPGVTTH